MTAGTGDVVVGSGGLLEPLVLGAVTIPNRIMQAPMSQDAGGAQRIGISCITGHVPSAASA